MFIGVFVYDIIEKVWWIPHHSHSSKSNCTKEAYFQE